MPEASEAKPPLEGAETVTLTADGMILVDRDGKAESLSVEKLIPWLCDRVAKFEKKPEGSVKPAERPGAMGTPTEMPIVIRADGNAPWLHVQRLLEACRQAGISRTAFGVKGSMGSEGRLGPAGAQPLDAPGGIKLAVRIAVTKEQLAVWGPTQVAVKSPSEIMFRMGGIEAREIDAVRRFLRDAGQTAAEGGNAIRATVEPDAKVPWSVAVSVLNEYHRAGLPDAGFTFVDAVPTADERRAARLPYPSK